AVPNVLRTVKWSTRFVELLRRKPPIDGPIARARLAVDCIIPSDFPCSCSCESFETRLVSDGDAIALPSDRIADATSKAASPPVCASIKGNTIRLTAIIRHPAAARTD